MMHPVRKRALAGLLFAGVVAALGTTVWTSRAAESTTPVQDDEAKRVAVVDKVKPSVVAIFARGGQGGGSGVLISGDGYALTNYHVVASAGPTMKCGLPDGILYDAVLVGLDKVGDVALIKLLPKEKNKDFPFAVMGDSEKVQAGDWSLAMGNPFLLATDFNPTVTFGMISGVHRYQYPAGTLLEYTDCIQIDTSINPGNSGGPLFSMDAELIGINGRGSFDKRGRVNSGVGYAISINQIKNFLGHLKAGIDTDHATLGATVDSEGEDGSNGRLVVKQLLTESDVRRRGLDEDDELVSFAGRPMTSVNQFKNILGIFPKGWRLPMVYRRNNAKKEILVRLMQLRRTEDPNQNQNQPKPRQPMPKPQIDPALAKLYQPKPGYANYYFNKVEQDRLLAGFAKHGNFTPLNGTWTIEGEADVRGRKSPFSVTIGEEADRGKDGKTVARSWTYHLKTETLPALPDADATEDKMPRRLAVRKAAALLRKHAATFPQEVLGKDDDSIKEDAQKLQKAAAAALPEFQEALEQLRKTSSEKEESRLWQANYDYHFARLAGFVAYIHEYENLLGQIGKGELPKRDAKKHRGYRMVPDTTLHSGKSATPLADEAQSIWLRMLKDYKDTIWEDRAQDIRHHPLGLRWQPTGGTRTLVRLKLDGDYDLDPLKVGQELAALKDPPRSGGLLTALYQYRRLLTVGSGGFEGGFHHGGQEPIYPPSREKKPFKETRIDTEVLHTEHAAVPVAWHFSLKNQTLLAFEAFIDKEDDPCEVYLSDYRADAGRLLPYRLDIRYGNDVYGSLTINNIKMAEAK